MRSRAQYGHLIRRSKRSGFGLVFMSSSQPLEVGARGVQGAQFLTGAAMLDQAYILRVNHLSRLDHGPLGGGEGGSANLRWIR
jgi:hypothetical protein